MSTIIIIGAGIAGLAAGCYARMNGYEVCIYEQQVTPGGLCTAWQREGFTFDGCLSGVVGCAPGKEMSHLWQELGGLSGQLLPQPEIISAYHSADGTRTFSLPWALPQLEEEMGRLSPSDRGTIREILTAVHSLMHFSDTIEAFDTGGFARRLRLATRLGAYMRFVRTWEKVTLTELGQRFRDPFLRRAFTHTRGDSALSHLFLLARQAQRNVGQPRGGSATFSQAIAARYRGLGGKLHLGKSVEKVIVEGGRAVGVRLAGGSEERADEVVSAADGHATLYGMLAGRPLERSLEYHYKRWPPSPALVQVSFGLRLDLVGQPPIETWELKEPIQLGADRLSRLNLRHYGQDSSLAPPGCCVAVVRFASDIRPWVTLRQEGAAGYRAAKEEITARVIALLEERLPSLRDSIEALDVATPLTWERITGCWNGAAGGWLPTTQNGDFSGVEAIPHKVPGLGTFWMTGQWVTPGGGVAAVAQDARRVIQRLCKEDNRPFQTRKEGEREQ
ncbi:MAG: NAD(P)/FAD-dependent oxidoreductase [Coprothermobacterota bacterium]|nr:NAD(P)/FAD-dependent oxidoreductase [Coprothermobacterota bacterium]